MRVGNKAIDGNWDNTFEQDCGCKKFPCSCYVQTKDGQWSKLIPIKKTKGGKIKNGTN